MWSKEKTAAYNRKYRLNNAERISIRRKAFYLSNRARLSFERKLKYKENPEPAKKRAAKRRLQNAVGCAIAIARWQKAHPDRANAINRKHKAAKLKALPFWADLGKIEKFYSDAQRLSKETGIAHQVDHIVPLQSSLVSGLHVEANLRIIHKSLNCSKQNRFWPNMP